MSAPPADAESQAGLKPRRVLLVDDNYDNRQIYREILAHFGHQVLEAENGKIGVDLAHRSSPDVILMDLHMPVMDGWEALAVLKSDSQTRPIPVVALTANVLLVDAYETAMAAGFADYITKPILPSALAERLERVCSRARAGQG